jgi:hypothetical protein
MGKSLVDFEELVTWPVRVWNPVGRTLDLFKDVSTVVYDSYQKDWSAVAGTTASIVYGSALSNVVKPLGNWAEALSGLMGTAFGSAVEDEAGKKK